MRDALFKDDANGEPNTYLTPKNLARLNTVAAALECDPAAMLNNFLAEELVTPSTIADGMDFTEDGRLDEEEAAAARLRVMAAAVDLDNDEWTPEYFIPKTQRGGV